MQTSSHHSFKTLCRRWRQFRKLSQLELALAADVSQRHVSWLENGRSAPSRDMILRLADAMNIPLRERNALFRSAGFAPAYTETDLSAPGMQPILDALRCMLLQHEPLPALVIDRAWNIKMTNQATDRLFSLGEDPTKIWAEIGDGAEMNLALMTLHPKGFRRFIVNWEQAGPVLVKRLENEALALGQRDIQERFARYVALVEAPAPNTMPTGELLPVLPLELDFGGTRLSLFSVIATFGTPMDVTTDELRIETFYPTNSASREFFEAVAREAISRTDGDGRSSHPD